MRIEYEEAAHHILSHGREKERGVSFATVAQRFAKAIGKLGHDKKMRKQEKEASDKLSRVKG